MKTYSAKPTDVTRQWHVIDASEAPLGRISTVAAQLLTGKGKPMFTSHIDTGDYVIIINSDKLVVTGKKDRQKAFYRHSGYPGALKELKLHEQMDKDSTKVIFSAVRGMLPVNKLRADRLARLKIYTGAEHDHTAQKPNQISVKEAK